MFRSFRRGFTWIVLGVGSTLLRLLWFLQGADLVHVRPILCVANCQPLQGGSIGWMTAGALFSVLGVVALVVGLRRGRPGRGRRTAER
jgi:hypothetical protein